MSLRFAAIALLLLAGCATPGEHPSVQATLAALLPADSLLVGEQHDAPNHQRIQRALIDTLAARNALAAVVVLEMAEASASTANLSRSADEADALVAGSGHVLRDRGVPVHLAPVMAARVLLLQAGNAASDPSQADLVLATAALPPTDYCASLRQQFGPARQ